MDQRQDPRIRLHTHRLPEPDEVLIQYLCWMDANKSHSFNVSLDVMPTPENTGLDGNDMRAYCMGDDLVTTFRSFIELHADRKAEINKLLRALIVHELDWGWFGLHRLSSLELPLSQFATSMTGEFFMRYHNVEDPRADQVLQDLARALRSLDPGLVATCTPAWVLNKDRRVAERIVKLRNERHRDLWGNYFPTWESVDDVCAALDQHLGSWGILKLPTCQPRDLVRDT